MSDRFIEVIRLHPRKPGETQVGYLSREEPIVFLDRPITDPPKGPRYAYPSETTVRLDGWNVVSLVDR